LGTRRAAASARTRNSGISVGAPHERTALTGASPDALSAHLPLLEKQVSNAWMMGKDGRHYWPIAEQAEQAECIATRQGRSPQERTALKKRLLRKWMSK